MENLLLLLALAAPLVFVGCKGCQFYPPGEYLRFVRVPETLPKGSEVLSVEVHPRRNLTIQHVEKPEDVQYFNFKAINRTFVSVRLAKSLEDLVDSESPQNVLKFRLVCNYDDEDDTISSYLSVTVYVEDVNDHAPVFVGAPYHITVDELTPTGLTLFRGIQAVDHDKPNTANSEIVYSITGGNGGGKFALEVGLRPALVLKRPLDYDTGDREFLLSIFAADRGMPPRNSTTILKVTVNDNDDLGPRFSSEVYKTQIMEFYPITGRRVHKELHFNPRIEARDEDRGINASIRYDIIAGNERRLFTIDSQNGSLFLEREVDLDSLPGSTFNLQIQATQVDNPLKMAVARAEIEILDINDNQPEFEVEAYNISIVENLPNGFSVLQVVASDRDQGDNGEFIYHLVDPSQAFSIDSRSGWLTVRNQEKLDRETRPSLSMRVFAREKMPSAVSSSSDSFVVVEVTLLDANDNNPTFLPTNLYEFTASSKSPIGHIIGKVEAVDPDLGRNGMVLYDLKKGNKTSRGLPVVVSPQTGEISVSESPLPLGRRSLFIEASDQPANPSERRFSLAVVTIDIIQSDKVEIQPDFIGAPYEFWVGDDVPVGTSVGQIRVTESLEKTGPLYDLLHSYHEGVPFAVEESSGTITVVDDISKFEHVLYDFEAVVTNGRSVTIITNVTIHIADSQMSSLQNPSLLEFRVRENLSGAMVGRIVTGPTPVKDTSRLRPIKFSIANHIDSSQFAISQDGTLYTQRSLDREHRDSYFLTIITQNGRGDRYYQVHVTVEDENDNAPMFERNWYEGHVREDCYIRCNVQMDFPIRATDPDKGPNSEYTVYLQGSGSDVFAITPTGKIVLQGPLDRETKDVYSMMLVAKDKGNLSSQVRLTIHVDDINDNAPKIQQITVPFGEGTQVVAGGPLDLQIVFGNETILHSKGVALPTDYPTVKIPENFKIGSLIFRVLATDKDLGENATVTYSISSETYVPKVPRSKMYSTHHFVVHPITGEVTIAGILPPESEFLVNITASDVGNLRDSVVIRVQVEDINDNAPLFEKPWYEFQVMEGIYSGQIIGKVVARDVDFGDNGNVSYSILHKRDNKTRLPFRVSRDGEISLVGEIDREIKDSYAFRVLSQDNGPVDRRLRSTVEVVVNILDMNDNAPVFYGYDKVVQTVPSQLEGTLTRDSNEFEAPVIVPVYMASVVENASPGLAIAHIFANDSDLVENGNGIVLFDVYRKKNHKQLFSINKDGIVTITSHLDYESQTSHNVTIIASDLGQPSLSSTALLVVSVLDVAETAEAPKSLVSHNYYELEVEENCVVPLEILKLNVSKEEGDVRFSLVPTLGGGVFRIDSLNGSLFLMTSPDRESSPMLQAKIKVNSVKRSRKIPHVIYPVYPEDLAPNEVKVTVRVKDVNDNSPKFVTNGRPLVAAIPTSAGYGYPIVRLHATDQDEGINGEIRYHMLSREDGESAKFIVDSISGQVRAIVSFHNDAGKVYGFDVKATDKKGSDDGRSAIANVFVYILDEHKKLVMVLGAKPIDIERKIGNITSSLSNITGLDVRVRKLEPHMSKDATDIYLYAVDPLMNIVIDMDTLRQVLRSHTDEVRKAIEPFRMLAITTPDADNYVRKKHTPSHLAMSGLEFATIALGCIVFIGAVTSAFCIICLHRRRKKIDGASFGISHATADMIFRSKDRLDSKPRSLFHPSAFLEDSTDSYGSNKSDCGRYRRPRRHRHAPSCARHHTRRRQHERTPGNALLKTSLASVHSSGRDSGIVEPHHGCCPCGHSPTHSSNSSHGSYEDSLKSLHRHHSQSSGGSGGCLHGQQTLVRGKSIREDHGPTLSRVPSERHILC